VTCAKQINGRLFAAAKAYNAAASISTANSPSDPGERDASSFPGKRVRGPRASAELPWESRF